MSQSPDAIYWRRNHHGEPEILYIEEENIHFYPGDGPCVDGFYYWKAKQRKGHKTQIIKRIPLEIWRQWGRQRHAPPKEKPVHLKGYQAKLPK